MCEKKWIIWLYFYLPPPDLVGWRNCEQTVEINPCGWMLSGLRHSEALSPLKVVTVPLNVSLTLITGSIVSLEQCAKYNGFSARGFRQHSLYSYSCSALWKLWNLPELSQRCTRYVMISWHDFWKVTFCRFKLKVLRYLCAVKRCIVLYYDWVLSFGEAVK